MATATHTIELQSEHGHTVQHDVALEYDPTSWDRRHEVRDLIREIVWQHGAEFQAIEGEDGYEGWSRFTINISPPCEEEE